MRLRLTFKIYKLPILYRHRIIALIKEALTRSDPLYKKFLYPDESGYSKRVKPFTFSLSLPPQKTVKKERFSIDEHTQIEDMVFYFSENSIISLFISSCDYQFIANLYNGLLEIREFEFNEEITLKLNTIFILNEKRIVYDEATFKTNTPILIEDKDGSPLIPLNYNLAFNDHFNAVHDRILKDLRGKGLYKTMEFQPLELKKKVVKHTLKGFREKTGKPFMTLTCFEGCFKLKGDPRDLQMLYQIGIGLRTGQGFGMIEIV